MVNHREDVFLGHDDEVFAIDFDFGAGVGREEHGVAFLDREGHAVAGFSVQDAVEGHDLAFLGLVLCGLGQEDAGVGAIRGFRTLHDDLVAEGTNLHGPGSPVPTLWAFVTVFQPEERTVPWPSARSSNCSVWSGRSKTRTRLPGRVVSVRLRSRVVAWWATTITEGRLPSPEQSHEGPAGHAPW